MSAEPAARFSARPEPVRPADVPPPSDPHTPVVPVAMDVHNIALTVIAAIAFILLLQYAQAVVIPVVLGVLMSYALEPIVAFLVRARFPRPVAAGIVLLMLTA